MSPNQMAMCGKSECVDLFVGASCGNRFFAVDGSCFEVWLCGQGHCDSHGGNVSGDSGSTRNEQKSQFNQRFTPCRWQSAPSRVFDFVGRCGQSALEESRCGLVLPDNSIKDSTSFFGDSVFSSVLKRLISWFLACHFAESLG
jgi:hypothetical protein